jgi:hypothetical protein
MIKDNYDPNNEFHVLIKLLRELLEELKKLNDKR